MPRIVLAGQDWRLRALLRAQLLEEGFEVEAHESTANALAELGHARILPELLIADLAESSDPAGDAEGLVAWAKFIPVWLLATRNTLDEGRLAPKSFEKVLFRPLDLTALVAQIKQRFSSL